MEARFGMSRYTLRSLFWALVLLALIIYVFSLLLAQEQYACKIGFLCLNAVTLPLKEDSCLAFEDFHENVVQVKGFGPHEVAPSRLARRDLYANVFQTADRKPCPEANSAADPKSELLALPGKDLGSTF